MKDEARWVNEESNSRRAGFDPAGKCTKCGEAVPAGLQSNPCSACWLKQTRQDAEAQATKPKLYPALSALDYCCPVCEGSGGAVFGRRGMLVECSTCEGRGRLDFDGILELQAFATAPFVAAEVEEQARCYGGKAKEEWEAYKLANAWVGKALERYEAGAALAKLVRKTVKQPTTVSFGKGELEKEGF